MSTYTPTVSTRAQISKAFTYHASHGDQSDRYNEIRDLAGALAIRLAHYCPESRELSLALTHLEDASMWAIRSIAANEAGPT